jgi:glycosyltransferase involved in cell wall biosynthesis
MTISFWTSSPPQYRALLSHDQERVNGGVAYEIMMLELLGKHHEVTPRAETVYDQKTGLASYVLRCRTARDSADIVITQPTPLVASGISRGKPTVAIIHHINYHLKSRPVYGAFCSLLFGYLRKVNLVVTVSAFWRHELERMGCRRVRTIYNSFELSEYTADGAMMRDFKLRHSLQDKPIVYLGKAAKGKGVDRAARALQGLPVHLVATGPPSDACEEGVRVLDLDRRDYVSLLHCSSVVVAMSSFLEGWNRVAHEAMLCGTPVVGSGAGGMRELLLDSGQTQVTSGCELRSAVEQLLKNGQEIGQRGKLYASQFDTAYFQREWLAAIESVLGREGAQRNS